VSSQIPTVGVVFELVINIVRATLKDLDQVAVQPKR